MRKTYIRVFSFLMAICLIFSCCACGEENVKNAKDDNSSITSSSDNTSSEPTADVIITQPTVDEEFIKYYNPTSLTLSFYDTSASSYGFTWNTEFEPKDAMIQICEGASFDESKCKEYKAKVKMEAVYMPGITYMYVCKVEIPLDQNKNYTYRAFDKVTGVGSEVATFKTANLKSDSFTFVHMSDSQVAGDEDDLTYSAIGTGDYLTQTLKGIFENKPSFILHTGDFVENSKYETYWKNMLHTNAKYLMKMPVMALSGNHETTYLAGSNETFKHFNVKIPEQTTNRGYYYSFNYGNTKFIMLNTNNLVNQKLESDQYNWLVNELKTNDKKWLIVSMHNPMYSVGKYGADPSKNVVSLSLRTQLSSLFATYGVDLVLQGHDHAYSKTYPIKADGLADTSPTYETLDSVKYTINPTGTIYAMHGPAGNQNRSPYSVDNSIYEMATKSNTNSWAEISIEDNRLTVHIKYYKNAIAETAYSYGIIKK